MSIEKLVEISQKYGNNVDYVLAGGGNTSYKTDELVYVKGSGTSLATIKAEEFVVLKRKELNNMWNKTYPDDDAEKEAEILSDMMNARIEGEGSKRPSVETLLHNLFVQKFVLHVHPALVNGITCAKDGENAVKKIFGDKVIWVPSVKPGYTLAVYCRQAITEYKNKFGKEPDILILQNHGIFFAHDDVSKLDEMVQKTMSIIMDNVKRKPDFSGDDIENIDEIKKGRVMKIAPVLRMLYGIKTKSGNSVAKFIYNREIENICESIENFKPLIKPFSPDHIVYYKAEPLFVEFSENIDTQIENIKKSLESFIEKNKYIPKIIAIEKLGCFAFGNTKKECDTAAILFLDAVKISVYAESFGAYLPLSPELTDFIIHWEVESYRQKVSLSANNIKRLDEKVCIITGSAQGFGRGIAEQMISEGANAVIADMNYKGAELLSADINKKCGVNKTIAADVNVADETSVKAMIEKCVFEFGGIDIFVNNAGIVRAGGLDELEAKDFNLVTSVNYTAYFLCVKYASEIMKIQHRINPDYFMDIIEINSKSGLTGSNKNFAYSGSKFGGIGLTQSFALELAEYNIKVNAVCPGNFLDGPLWSDPQTGLFMQYLKAGKVPGAKTIEDVKKFYEAKVPLNRGCQVDDVMKAVLYAIEQKYETGQAIPVTGGQEMLP